MASLCCLSLRRSLVSSAVLCSRRQPVALRPFARCGATAATAATAADDVPVHKSKTSPDPVPGEFPLPPKEGQRAVAGDKVTQIVTLVKSLTLVETVQLIDTLKTELNIADIVMSGGGGGGGAAAEEEVEEAAPVVEQTEFTVKIEEFAAESKIKLIKEIKGSIDGLNLVQARKMLDELPATVQSNIDKESAEALKAKLEAAGAKIKLE